MIGSRRTPPPLRPSSPERAAWVPRRSREIVDDGSPRTNQQRQEGLGHVIRTEQVDGEMLFQRDAITHLTDKGYAGVIDEDIERLHFLDSSLNLLPVGDVQCQRRDTRIGVGQGLPRTGIHPLRAPAQSFLDQRPADASIGTGYENGFACDFHYCWLLSG